MRKFRHHKYTFEMPFGHPQHSWSLVGPQGGIHFHVRFYSEDKEPACGLEAHKSRGHKDTIDRAPDHTTCWLTGEPCWHDGTSLYAMETLWPMVKHSLEDGRHEEIFRVLEHEYRTFIEDERE